MPDLYVGIGSNVDPVCALRAAVEALERSFGDLRCSEVYAGPAQGAPGADYLNMVASSSTTRASSYVLEELRTIELAAGRSRTDPARCELDLDLLLYGSRVDAAQRLPRPGVLGLSFVLGPLAELAPELVHPVTGARVGDVWRRTAHGELVRLGALRSLG